VRHHHSDPRTHELDRAISGNVPLHDSGRIVASLDRKCLGQKAFRESGTSIRGIFDKETTSYCTTLRKTIMKQAM
jgi:hypothetical protein